MLFLVTMLKVTVPKPQQKYEGLEKCSLLNALLPKNELIHWYF